MLKLQGLRLEPCTAYDSGTYTVQKVQHSVAGFASIRAGLKAAELSCFDGYRVPQYMISFVCVHPLLLSKT